MMTLRIWLVACLALFAWGAQARTSVPIVNHENISIVPASGRAPAVEDVRKAIMTAAANNSWELTEPAPGQFVATLHVRGKHTVSTDIRYTTQSFSVTYRDSANMNFRPGEPVGLIHPHYNDWVQSLVAAIRVRVNAL